MTVLSDAKSHRNFVPTCVSCGSKHVDFVGKIPDSALFAGLRRDPILGGALWRCRDCRLGFRHPRMSEGKARAMYEDAPGTAWRSSFEERPDWIIARGWIAGYGDHPLDVLDIGCADGKFLSDGVFDPHRKFGIEINPLSAAAAAAAGIEMIGETLSDLTSEDGRRFDIITAFDVIEHVIDPRIFVLQAMRLLREGGRLIIASGDLSAGTFQFMGGLYWYASIPEHFSFISLDWCAAVSEATGVSLLRHKNYAHKNASVFSKLRQLVANIIYKGSPVFYSSMRNKFSTRDSNMLDKTPPSWMTATDHLIVEISS